MTSIDRVWDVAIIGAGIAGTAVAHQLARYDLDVLILERLGQLWHRPCRLRSDTGHPDGTLQRPRAPDVPGALSGAGCAV